MKMVHFIVATAALTVSGLVRSNAQEMMAGDKPVDGAPANSRAAPVIKPVSRAEEILKRFDKNGDGRLDDDEKADAHEATMQEQIAKDTPPPAPQGLAYFPALALELFDRNHDGRLSDEERLSAMVFLEWGDPVATRGVLLARFDRNGDRKLDDGERRESQAYATEHRGELMQEILLRRFDANGNGALGAEEKTAIRAAFLMIPALASADAERPDEQPAIAPALKTDTPKSTR
jgi:Ca2+-binding EF-hand superfamily protein